MSAFRRFASEKGRAALFSARRVSPAGRALPDFIVIGAQKAGTSSMFSYLRQHPQVSRPMYKEIYYFDRHYSRGLSWYRCNFPARATLDKMSDRYGRRHVTFEATATYIFDANAPRRIAQDLETNRFVALLRNPIDRAISNYWHARRQGLETRALKPAMEAELEACDTAAAEPPRRGYLDRGIYHRAVARWLDHFPRESMLLIQSEKMFADPASVMARVFAFLDLEPFAGIDYAPLNTGDYVESDDEVRRLLGKYYAPHNEILSRMCGTQFDWSQLPGTDVAEPSFKGFREVAVRG
jgi:hypothetical protein